MTISGTRETLLRSARNAFATTGFARASVRSITSAAGANLGAITYHFGSKQALYEAVLESVLSPLMARVERATAEGQTPADKIRLVLDAFFAHLSEHPDTPQLMIQELAAGREPPPPVARLIQTVARYVSGAIREGQQAGDFREGDPLLMTISMIAQPIHLTLTAHLLKAVMSFDPSAESERARLTEHAVSFALGGLGHAEARE